MIFTIPLLIEFVLGFLARLLLKDIRWTAWGFVLVPLSIAFIIVGPRNFFSAGGGEAHEWSVSMFIGFVVFGIVAYIAGMVVGQLLRKKAT